MATETTCPTCGSPVTIREGGRQYWSPSVRGAMHQAIPPDYHPVIDPARVKAMEEVLGDIKAGRYAQIPVWVRLEIAALLPAKEKLSYTALQRDMSPRQRRKLLHGEWPKEEP